MMNKIAIKWPKVVKTFDNISKEERYKLLDGTNILLSEKDKKWKKFSEI